MLQVADTLVEAILLPVFQRGIEPRSRVVRIELGCVGEFLARQSLIAGGPDGFAGIAADQRARGFEDGGGLKIVEGGLGNGRSIQYPVFSIQSSRGAA